MVSFSRLFSVALGLTSIASAAPAPIAEAVEKSFPEFIPPPGFPSLAELNVTTEQLRTTKPKGLDGIHILQEPMCGQINVPGHGGIVGANVDDVIVCFNFLVALDTYVISVGQGNSDMGLPGTRQVAQYGSAYINVQSMTSGTASSWSKDVALGVQWVFTNCNRGGLVGGYAPANGNGDLRVWASGRCC